jgi:cold shock CspA family protein
MTTETGTIKNVMTDRGFGFIRSGGVDYFFHVSDLSDGLEFNEQLRERVVQFNLVIRPRDSGRRKCGQPSSVDFRRRPERRFETQRPLTVAIPL